jgi:peroxin-11B
MRVGKFVEHFRAAAIASDAKSMDPVLRFTTIGRQLGYAFYMLLDNACVVSQHEISLNQIVYRTSVNEWQLDAVNIRKFSTAPRLLREGYRAWFTGLSFSIASGIYSYYGLSLRSKAIASSSDPEKVVEKKKVEKELNAVKIQLLSDLCDITIPSSALGWVDLDDGIVGLAGTTSSLLGVWGQWKKTA